MKKRSLLLVLVMSLFILTGCESKSPLQQVKDVLLNHTECENFKVDMSLNLKVEQEGVAVDVALPVSVAYSNKIAQVELKDNAFIGKVDFYLDNNKAYVSSKLFDSLYGVENDDEYYIVEDIEQSDESSNDISMSKEEIEKFIDSFGEENITLVGEDGDVKQYRITYTKSVMDYILSLDEFKEAKESLNESEINLDNLSFSMDLYLNTKTKSFVKLSLNLKDIIKEIGSISEEVDEDFEESLNAIKNFDVTIELSGCNSTTVSIPDDVKNNAITMEEYQDIMYELMDEYYDSYDYDYEEL